MNDVVLTRIHSSKFTNDILGILTGSIRKGLEDIFKLINESENGAILFINHEQTPENLLARIGILKQMQEEGKDNIAPPMKMDFKDFGIGAQILHNLNIKKLKVISNSKQAPRIGITGYGITIAGYQNY